MLALLALGLSGPVVAAQEDALPTRARAERGQWEEAATEHFVIVYQRGDEPQRDYYLGRVEPLYDGLAAVFGTPLETPITLRLYPTLERYLEANPLAVEVAGVVAHAHHGRREVGVAVPRALGRGDAGLDNTVRHELTHLFAHRLSGGRLPAGFHEGVAQYLEQPGEHLATGVARLRGAWDRDGLYGWSALAEPAAAYRDPAVLYPQSLSVVHFLVADAGFPALLDWLRAFADGAGWREALETAYGRSPQDLETAWRRWLPSYLDGGWRAHALYARGLGPAEAQLARGEFAAARAHLASALALLETADPETAERARALLAQAEAGQAATAQLRSAADALAAGAYTHARAEAAAAEAALRELGDSGGAATAAEVAARAETGLDARAALERARALPPWRSGEARYLAYEAARGYGRLGNDAAAGEARRLLAALDRRQAPLGWALLVFGVLLVGWNVRRRRAERVPWL